MSQLSFANARLPLPELPDKIYQAVLEGRVAYTVAAPIKRIKDNFRRNELLQRAIVARDIHYLAKYAPSEKKCHGPEKGRLVVVLRRIRQLKVSLFQQQGDRLNAWDWDLQNQPLPSMWGCLICPLLHPTSEQSSQN